MPEETDPARIAALEAALADAQAEVERLRKFERETEMLRDRVAALQQQVISLRPPKVPVIKDPGVSGPPEAFTASLRVEARERALKDARRERTVLGAVILLAVTATAGGGTTTYDGTTKSPSACVVTGIYKGDLTCTNNPGSVGPGFGTTTIVPGL